MYEDSILIFIIPPNAKVLYERLKKRGTETDLMIEKRLEKALIESTDIKKYDYILVNDNLENTMNNFFKIVDGTFENDKNYNLVIENILNDIKEKKYV